MRSIKKLPENLISKIAAGEVIERPASIVKELLENSIDAEASEITLKVEKNGLEEITVIDNGTGIPGDEIEKAFTQHATSKIENLEDLNKILTLGFRGEALASIAAVADVKVITKSKGENATLAKFSNSEIVEKEKTTREIGTTISVFELFRHVPARKKFLSSGATEYKHIYNTFVELALSRPDIHFKLIRDGKIIKNLPTQQSEERIFAIYNINEANQVIPLFYDSPAMKISGFLGHPEMAHDTSPKQHLFLNKRPIEERTVYAAIKDGFASSLPRDRKPSYFLFIDINPEEVDVNVHPRKKEVRFTNKSEIYKSVKHTTSSVLEKIFKESLLGSFGDSESSQQQDVSRRIHLSTSYNTSRQYSPKARSAKRGGDIQGGLEFTKNLLSESSAPEGFDYPDVVSRNKSGYVFIGQVLKTYLIYESEGKVLILDQHAADERVNYDRLEKAFNTNAIDKQPLLIPFNFEIQGERAEALEGNISTLRKLGIEITHSQDDSFQLSSIPSFLRSSNLKHMIEEIIDDSVEHLSSALNLEAFITKVVSTIACHGSIRAGDIVEKESAIKLIDDLFGCKLPYSCPHGRRIIWEMDNTDIAKNFERHV
ncbi:MAG TPA: DNA mismatch repair endonuclease MutL [Candidatus Dojkabacteria bacterium]|jgi:DNA mismatch repair protein MutL